MNGEFEWTNSHKIQIDSDTYLQLNNNPTQLTLVRNDTAVWSNNGEFISDFYFVHYWLGSHHVIFCDEYSSQVVKLDLNTGKANIVYDLARKGHESIYRTHFLCHDNGVVIVYEQGVVSFNMICDVLWSIKEHSLDTLCLGIKENTILFESEFVGRWAYSLVDGKKVI